MAREHAARLVIVVRIRKRDRQFVRQFRFLRANETHQRAVPRRHEIVETREGHPLPFSGGSFELVVSRHPVRPNWSEIARVLTDGGRYFAQHVGPASAFELIEHFLGPLPKDRAARDAHREVAEARAAGLEVVDLRTARCRMEFFDIGAVVYILRKCVWWVPDFSIERYRDVLRHLDGQIRSAGSLVAHSTRHLVEVRRDGHFVLKEVL